jgi:hypothetical protein
MLDRDSFREAYNEAMAELGNKEDTIKALQAQVWGLKSFVSTNSKMDEQIADESFGENMQRIGNSIQNWVITNFRRAKIGMSQFLFQACLYFVWLWFLLTRKLPDRATEPADFYEQTLRKPMIK